MTEYCCSMDVEQAACHAHDELVYFLQVDEDASTMVKRIQSFQLKSGKLRTLLEYSRTHHRCSEKATTGWTCSCSPWVSFFYQEIVFISGCVASGVPLLDQVGACRKGGAVELLCPSRCSSTLCLQTVIRFVLPSQWQGVAIQGLEGLLLSRILRGQHDV